MFRNKQIHVCVAGDANVFYSGINHMIEQEILQNKTGTFLQTLFQSINAKKEELRLNPFYGIQIPKKLVPKKYAKTYQVKNLWKCNLALAWRAIYFISGEEERIIVTIIDILDHRKYSKIFGYRK